MIQIVISGKRYRRKLCLLIRFINLDIEKEIEITENIRVIG